MSMQESAPDGFTTIPHYDELFDGKSIYLSGQSFIRCRFQACTLIIKDVTLLGLFENCSFENCVWHLNMTICDPHAWQEFLKDIAPAITSVLPVAAK